MPPSRLRFAAALAMWPIMVAAPYAYAATWFVDDDGPIDGDGTSWATPFLYLQDALVAAAEHDTIRVAGGCYTPDRDTSQPHTQGDRRASFQLDKSLTIQGGYAGWSKPQYANERDIRRHRTVLSGDLLGNDTSDRHSREDNSYHVVSSRQPSDQSILDGLTISGGNANFQPQHEYGGGLYITAGLTTLIDCTFSGNQAYKGGGSASPGQGRPSYQRCHFVENYADATGGASWGKEDQSFHECLFYRNQANGAGGGLFLHRGASILKKCIFWRNEAEHGGAAYSDEVDLTVDRCRFVNNVARGYGGAWRSTGQGAACHTCLFFANSAALEGGAIYENTTIRGSIQSCVFLRNSAPTASAISHQGDTGTSILNCIIWDNRGATSPCGPHHQDFDIQCSCVPSLLTGPGNIHADPRLAVDGFHLLGDSPCIDAGTQSLLSPASNDIDDEPRLVADAVDIGADEWLDTDRDHLPDWWEMKYFLGAEAADPNANTDADQRDNLTEFHSGTNPARFPTTLYVDDDAPPGGDGSSWNHAFPTLQDALCRISDGDVVHIAGGTYKPDLSSNGVFPILDRSATFYLTAGTVLAGGFAGLDNLLDPDMQDIENHETIFTGDLTGDDAADKPQTDDNANNVVTAHDVPPSTVVDGVTITAGNATGTSPKNGFRDPPLHGAGLRAIGGSPTLTRCTFRQNKGEAGAGVYAAQGAAPVFDSCTLSDNWAQENGGAMHGDGAVLRLTNCGFQRNAAKNGGALFLQGESTAYGVDCFFGQNLARRDAAAIFIDASGQVELTGCTLARNLAMRSGTIRTHQGPLTTIDGCIIWGNAPQHNQLAASPEPAHVSHSCIEGGYAGPGNLESDPLLTADAAHLNAASPAIDAGTVISPNRLDIDGEPRAAGTTADIGVDEWIDDDQDGLPNWWERQHFGSDTAALPDADADLDNRSNLDEYAGNTDPNQPQRTFYVDDDAAPDGDGSSWSLPIRYLQDAIHQANAGDTILVATGIYTPDRSDHDHVAVGDRTASFQLKEGVAIYGGYAGHALLEAPQTRNPQHYPSTLSGDLLSDDLSPSGTTNDNSHHVALCHNASETAILDGFFVRDGTANGSDLHDSGAGLLVTSACPTITHCTFSHNTAANCGGAVCILGASAPTIHSSAFVNNAATSGACIAAFQSRITVTNTTFQDNLAQSVNNTTAHAAGVYSDESYIQLHNCAFVNNQANFATILSNNNGSDAILAHCTIAHNTTPARSPAIYNAHSNLAVANSIIWASTPHDAPIGDDGGTATVSHCCIQGGYPGPHNIDVAPLLTADNLHTQFGSPCINAAHGAGHAEAADIDGEPRLADTAPDIGADEWLDTDFDGMPDFWEDRYFGGPTAGDRAADDDNDGVFNIEEYLANTSPIALPCIYVDDDAPSRGDGGSWAHAFRHLQDAILTAQPGQQIRVAGGTYTPDQAEHAGITPTSRDHTFQLRSQIAIRGGYAGWADLANPDERSVRLYSTELSGDLLGNDADLSDPLGDVFSDNSYCVVTAIDADASAVLDGVTVRGGTAQESTVPGMQSAAGITIFNADPTLVNCTIHSHRGTAITAVNSAFAPTGCTVDHNIGVGINLIDSDITLTDCSVTGNTEDGVRATDSFLNLNGCLVADNDVAGLNADGSAITAAHTTFAENAIRGIKATNATLDLTNCDLSENGVGLDALYGNVAATGCTFSTNDAAGASLVRLAATLNQCRFADNESAGIDVNRTSAVLYHCSIQTNHGAGIRNDTGNVRLANCVLTRNVKDAIHSYAGVNELTNCTVAFNREWGLCVDHASTYAVAQSILWGNQAGGIHADNGDVVVTYSCVQGGWDGPGNLAVDPKLAFDHVHLLADSPCIDAGDPAHPQAPSIDVDGETRTAMSTPDIGADEWFDDDDDTLPNWWETLYFQTPVAGQPTEDPDTDQLTNIDEYATGRDPFLAPVTYYVSPEGDDQWDGLAPVWNGTHGPKATIQAAIDEADPSEGDSVAIADGDYTGPGNIDLNTQGKAVTVFAQSGPAFCTIDCQFQGRAFLFDSNETERTVIDGLRIANGFAHLGGAVRCAHSDPVFRECVLHWNSSTGGGGALYNSYGNVQFVRCQFIENETSTYGGAVFNEGYCQPRFADCLFWANRAIVSASGPGHVQVGGGLANSGFCHSIITNCKFIQNSAQFGAGLYNFVAEARLTDCDFWDNVAEEFGGGAFSASPNIQFTRCTFLRNSATDGGGVHNLNGHATLTSCQVLDNHARNGGGVFNDDGDTFINNCQVTHNTADAYGGGLFSGHGTTTLQNAVVDDNGDNNIYVTDWGTIQTLGNVTSESGTLTAENGYLKVQPTDTLTTDPEAANLKIETLDVRKAANGTDGLATVTVYDNAVVKVLGTFLAQRGALYQGAQAAAARLDAGNVIIACSGTTTDAGAKVYLTDNMEMNTEANVDLVGVEGNPTLDPLLVETSSQVTTLGCCWPPPSLEVLDNAKTRIGGSLSLGQWTRLQVASQATFQLAGSLFVHTIPSAWRDDKPPFDLTMGTLTMVHAADDQPESTIEAPSEDRGANLPGYVCNYAIKAIELAPGKVVTIVDEDDNQGDGGTGGDEAIYVGKIILGPDALLRVEAGTVYYGTIDNRGGTIENSDALVQITSVSPLDFVNFSDCFSGPDPDPIHAPATDCLTTYDVDCDFDVDLTDFIWLQNLATDQS